MVHTCFQNGGLFPICIYKINNEAVIHQLQREPESVQMGYDNYNSADKIIFEPHISEHVSGDDIETFEVIFLQQYK